MRPTRSAQTMPSIPPECRLASKCWKDRATSYRKKSSQQGHHHRLIVGYAAAGSSFRGSLLSDPIDPERPWPIPSTRWMLRRIPFPVPDSSFSFSGDGTPLFSKALMLSLRIGVVGLVGASPFPGSLTTSFFFLRTTTRLAPGGTTVGRGGHSPSRFHPTTQARIMSDRLMGHDGWSEWTTTLS